MCGFAVCHIFPRLIPEISKNNYSLLKTPKYPAMSG
jgi:hypothetical protein